MEKAVTRRKWTAGLIIAGAAALVITFWSLIMSMLSLLAVAGVLTLLSLPLCKVLEKRLPSGAAAAIALLTLLGAVLGMLWGLIPPLLRQSAQLMSRLPALLDSLRELLTRWSAALEARGIPLGDMQAELFSRISAAAGQLAATLVSGIRRLTGSVSQWLLAPLLSFYFLRDRKRFCLLLSLVLPVKYRARGIRAAREMRRESALYLRGQLILSLFVAAMTALALLLTRTPGALLLGLFMGVMELIPYIGPFIAGVPAVLLALRILRKKDAPKVWSRILIALTAISMAVIFGAMGYISVQGKDSAMTPDETPDFIVVLGAQVQGDRPSLTLKKRLDKALEFLQAHPDRTVIVSGGQGPDEAHTEASVMAQYLLAHGADASQILEEPQASNTRENLLFSAKLAEEAGVDTSRVLIVTSDFHMCRAKYIARTLGMEPYGLSSGTWPWILKLNYTLREVFAFCKAVYQAHR